MAKKYHCENYGPTILRIFLGLLFIVPGISKLLNPSGIIGLLGGLGFPSAEFFGWLLILSEIVFGSLVVIGFRLKYTVWPLVVILLVAAVTVHVPKYADPMGMINILWHLFGISALISLFLTGPGQLALE